MKERKNYNKRKNQTEREESWSHHIRKERVRKKSRSIDRLSQQRISVLSSHTWCLTLVPEKRRWSGSVSHSERGKSPDVTHIAADAATVRNNRQEYRMQLSSSSSLWEKRTIWRLNLSMCTVCCSHFCVDSWSRGIIGLPKFSVTLSHKDSTSHETLSS